MHGSESHSPSETPPGSAAREEPVSDKKIDRSWKEQIERERELERQRAAVEKPGGEEDYAQAPPPATFPVLISGLATQAFFHLGVLENPVTSKKEKDLPMARYSIESLAMLQEKTKGNLTADESRILENALHELRIQYVEQMKRS